jgi:hypothetical protein
MSFISFLSCVLAFCSIHSISALRTEGAVFIINPSAGLNSAPQLHFSSRLDHSSIHSAVAIGTFDATEPKIGWNILNVQTRAHAANDRDIAYAAGYVEGVLTAQQIYETSLNNMDSFFSSNSTPRAVVDFVHAHNNYVREQVAKHADDKFWVQMGLILAQLDGNVAGYQSVFGPDSPQYLDSLAFWLLNLDGDLEDIIPAVDPSVQNYHRAYKFMSYRNTHCSGLIKLTPFLRGQRELFVAHDTWDTFASMLRIYKHYNFKFNSESYDRQVSFSSSPGFLSSVDDFFVTHNQLAVIETTNGFFNESLFKEIVPQKAMSFERAIIANSLATSGAEWVQLFAQHNSGTYNNQWMIVDYKLFDANSAAPLPANTLWIIETLPHYIRSADVTEVLNKNGYWASYNIPYFTDIYYMSGFGTMYNEQGNTWSYSQCPRAQIFRRDQHKVINSATMQQIMTYNDYENDPLSLGDPQKAIMARADLPLARFNQSWLEMMRKEVENTDLLSNNNVSNGRLRSLIDLIQRKDGLQAFGGIDSKMTSNSMINKLAAFIMNGPTHAQQPPFRWIQQFDSVIHAGQPQLFDFDFILTQPEHL